MVDFSLWWEQAAQGGFYRRGTARLLLGRVDVWEGVGLLAPKRGPSLKSQARHLYRSRLLKAKVGRLFPEWQVRSLRLGKLHRDHCHTESPHGRPVR